MSCGIYSYGFRVLIESSYIILVKSLTRKEVVKPVCVVSIVFWKYFLHKLSRLSFKHGRFVKHKISEYSVAADANSVKYDPLGQKWIPVRFT